MTAVRLIREASLLRRPWKNGGGTTVEIAVFPADADFDSFDWRLSMAEIAADGPFSAFPNIDRTLVLIDGPGLILNVAGEPHRLNAASPVLSFRGDVAASGQLLGGAVRDFNVMTRRGRAEHSVHLVGAGEVGTEGSSLIVAHAAPIEVESGDALHRLGRFDALLSERSNTLRLSGPAILACIRLTTPV